MAAIERVAINKQRRERFPISAPFEISGLELVES